MIRQVDGPGGEPRFMMLETIREYGVEQLEASGEGANVRSRHAAFFLAFVERLWSGWFGGAGVAGRLDLVEIERDNLRAALTWADEQGAAEYAARITHALRMFWRMRGPVNEGRAWGERVLAYPTLPVHLRIELLCGAGDLAQMHGDFPRSLALKQEAVALARVSGPPVLHAGAMHYLGFTFLAQNRDDIAERLGEEALAVFRSVGDKNWTATALSNLASVAWRRGDAARAVTLWTESISLGREIGGYWAVGHTLGELAMALADLGDDERARLLYREPERAARLCGAIEVVLDALDGVLAPTDLTSFQRAEAASRSALTERAFQTAWAEGRAMTLEQAYADALAGISGSGPVSNIATDAGRVDAADRLGLTRRELDVLRLLAEGRADREIAAALFVSPRTVMTHVQHIFAKLGVHNRKAAAVFAIEHDLV
ncbi:MAG: LuxR C-terminal-related transcriptional regulator [Thermomicrobiales bacterium]